MADEQVGTVSVKVLPDTKGFRRKLKAELEKIERELDLDIEIGLQLSRADLLRARREIKALEKGAAIKVRVELDKTDLAREVRSLIAKANREADNSPISPTIKPAPWDLREFTRSLQNSIDEAVKDIEANVTPELQDDELRADLDRLLKDAEQMAAVEIEAELDDTDFRRAYHDLRNEIRDVTAQNKLDADTKAAHAQLEGFLQQMRDKKIELPIELDGVTEAALQAEELARSRQLDIYAVLHAARAAAQIAVLTHSRTLDVRAHISGSALGQIAGLIAGLAGLRAVFDVSSGLSGFLAQIDRSVPRIAAMTVGIAGLSAAVLAAGGALSQLAVGVGQSLRGLLMVPAAAAGVVTVFQVLKAAFRDAGQYVGDLSAQYSALGNQISAGFWELGERGVRNFTRAFIPLASQWLPEIGRGLGFMANEMSGVITNGDGLENIGTFFRNLSRTISADDQAMGIPDLTNAILDLVAAGSRHLPALGRAFNSSMEDFAAWTERISNDGTFDRWMREAGQATKDLGSILASTTRVFLAVADAAKEAGSPGLSSMAAGMRDVADAAESARGMDFMTTMFEGANQGIRNLMPGLRELGNSFVDLAPLMSRVMEISGTIFSELASGLSDVLDNPRFQSGILDMFESFEQAARNLRPVFQTAGTDIGMLAETVGMVAEAMSRVLGTAAEELGTVFQNLLSAVQGIIPPLRDGFVRALEAIGPIASAAAEGIADFVEAFPGLSAGLLVAGVGLGILLQTLGLIARPLVAAASGFVALKAALPGLAGMASGLGGAFGKILTPLSGIGRLLLRVGGWVAVAIAAFKLMWDNSDRLRESVGQLWEAFKGLGQGLADALGPALERLSQESIPDLMNAFGDLLGVLGPVFGFLGDQGARTIESIAKAIEGLTPAITTLVEGLAETFSNGLGFLTNILEFWSDVFSGDWDSAWQELKEIAESAFDTLGAALETGLNTATDGLTGLLDEFSPGWRDKWTALGEEAVTAIAEGLGSDTGEILTAANGIANIIEDNINGEGSVTFKSIGARIVTDIAQGIEDSRQGLGVIAAGIVTDIATGIDQVRDGFITIGSGIVYDIAQGIRETKEAARVAAVELVAAIVTEITFLPTRIRETMQQLSIEMTSGMIFGFQNMIGAVVAGVLETVVAFLLLPTRIKTILAEMATMLAFEVRSWFTDMKTEVETGVTGVETTMATMPERIRTIMLQVAAVLVTEVAMWFQGMYNQIVSGIATVVTYFSFLPSRVVTAVQSLGPMLATQAAMWLRGMYVRVVTGISDTVAQFATLPGRVLMAVQSIGPMLLTQAAMWLRGMWNSVVTGIAEVMAEFHALPGKITTALSGIKGMLISIGADMMTGLIFGIKNKAAEVAQAARSVVEGAVQAARNALNINSPSKVFMQIGEYTGAGYVKGLEHSESSVQAAVRHMVRPPKAVDMSGRAAALAAGQEINVTVQSRDGEDPTRVGRRAGEAIAFELGRHL